MVACGIFLALMLATTIIYDLSQRADRKADLHSETYREAAVALRHIRRELKGATVLLDKDDGEQSLLTYRVPEWRDGHVLVDHRGLPVWGPERQLLVTPEGALMRVEGAEQRILARLGEGRATFERTAPQLLRVKVEIEQTGKIERDQNLSRREISMTVGLANQQFWRDITILKKE